MNATATAESEFGAALFTNIIMLGALSAVTGMVSLDALHDALKGNVPAKTLDTNRAALKRGFELAKQAG